MEKLLQLLNEYEKKRIEKINSEWGLMVKLSFNPYTEENLTNGAYRSCWLEICSKYYGFIKWLVENEKIDNKKIADETYVKVNWEWYELILGCHYDLYQQVLMLLSIKDEPIEFLVSILK